MLEEFIHSPRVAYFSMEIALRNEITTYAGGLGVLAGDMVRSAVDLMIPMVAVCLVSRAGYFRQQIDDQGRQVELADFWQPELWAKSLDAKVAVSIEGRSVWIGAWLYVVEGHSGGRQPVLLLDTDLNENSAEDRELTHYLYGSDAAYRLKQEIILGIGGVRLLQALGFNIFHYHMNEGHSALLGIELMRKYAYPPEDLRQGESHCDIPRVREMCSFTTHTPVEAGHDRFSYDLVYRVFGSAFDLSPIRQLAGEDALNMTRLALNLSEYVNGVAKSHADISNKMFPGYKVHAITNGVHPFTWTADSFHKLYDTYIPGWCHESELLIRADCCISDAEIWEAHQQAKAHLIEQIFDLTGVRFDPKIPILGFARRMTAYKRPDMLFSDMERLKEIARHQPIQIVMGGKAHPSDEGGKALIAELHKYAQSLVGIIPTVYLPNYNLAIAHGLISGSDIWLNTPLRPYEASGTSGMKAAFNGVPSLSVLDGWWIEGCIEGVTGWAIGNETSSDVTSNNGNDAHALYDKLEHVVLPLYYNQDRGGWIKVMKSAISKNASYFNSHRMMRRYLIEAYTR
ncbi:MAG: alpha-glucan family phosphorylase [Methylotenera sp.]